MKYEPEKELRVLWIVKELGLASIEEVNARYKDLFEEEYEHTNLVLRRWKARRAFVMEGDRYKIADVPPWFRSLRMDQLTHLNKRESKTMLKDLEDMFLGGTTAGPTPKGKWGNFVKLELLFEALDPILGGRPTNLNGKTKFPREDERLVVPINWMKGLIRDNSALMNVAGLHRHIGWGKGYWKDEINTITLKAPVTAHGKGVGIAEYEAVPKGNTFAINVRWPMRGCSIDSIEGIQELFDMIAETPIRGLGANSRAYGGRIKLVEIKETA